MRAVVTVIGKDTIGIIAAVTKTLSENEINILDIAQSVLGDLFTMVMLVDISRASVDFPVLAGQLERLGEEKAVKIIAMHEDIFNAMHRI